MDTQNVQAQVKNGVQKLEGFVKTQFAAAQKGFHSLEDGAEKVLEELRHRGHRSRKELEILLQTLKPVDLKVLENPMVKQLGERAEKAGEVVRERAEKAGEVLRKRFDGLQARVAEVAGEVATRSEVKQLADELSRLSRKVNAFIGRDDEAAPVAEARPEAAEARPEAAEARSESAEAKATPAAAQEVAPVEAAAQAQSQAEAKPAENAQDKAAAKPAQGAKSAKKKGAAARHH